MFPIRDHNNAGITPYVTWGLMALNVAVFMWQQIALPSEMAKFSFEVQWAMIPARLSAGEGWVTPFTAMFLHGGWLHLGGNMLFLWIFGDNVEAAMGRVRYLGFYLCCGLIAALAEYAAGPYSRNYVIGASGAIGGVLGCYLVLFPKARVDVLLIFVIFFKVIPFPAWVVLGLWIAMQVFDAAIGQQGDVAYWEHIGGFAAGSLTGLVMNALRRAPVAPTTVRTGIPPVPRQR